MKITQINASTQEVIERDMSAEELAQWEADKAQAEAQAEAETKAKAEAQIKKAAVEAKLAALGLDSDDLKVLGLG